MMVFGASRFLRSTVMLSWVLWTTWYGLNQVHQEHWSLVRGYETFDSCKRAANREAEKLRKGHPFPEVSVSLYSGVRKSTTGAEFMATWQTNEQHALAEKEKKALGALAIGGTGLGEGYVVEYECWPSDVDLNHLKK